MVKGMDEVSSRFKVILFDEIMAAIERKCDSMCSDGIFAHIFEDCVEEGIRQALDEWTAIGDKEARNVHRGNQGGV